KLPSNWKLKKPHTFSKMGLFAESNYDLMIRRIRVGKSYQHAWYDSQDRIFHESVLLRVPHELPHRPRALQGSQHLVPKPASHCAEPDDRNLREKHQLG